MGVFGPLGGIIAAGNRATIKLSEFTPRTSALLARLIAETGPDIQVTMGAVMFIDERGLCLRSRLWLGPGT
jgi:acyl-CoA reductase-like NAD-dependent aldehyde dehydrogenase